MAVVGPSGVGKTTLVSLFLCFYRPTDGEVYFDDKPASDFEVRSLRQRIGYVAQRPSVLAGTIMDTLRYGKADAGKELLKRLGQGWEVSLELEDDSYLMMKLNLPMGD